MKLPKQFVENIRLNGKEKGEAWLQQLPSLIDYCEHKWSLKMQDPFRLSYNYVAPATLENHSSVVVKICMLGQDYFDELEAVQLFNGKGMVKLVDSDKEKGILILKLISPGNMLAEVEDDEEACRIASSVIKKLSRPVQAPFSLPTTKGREAKLRTIVNNHPNGLGPISKETYTNAVKIFTYLNDTIEHYFLLHGDFHHYNVLSSAEGRWIAIDPKGLIGEIEYDLIQFLLNKLPENGAYQVIEKRVDILTKELNLNKQRLLLWGFCHTVLATSWTVGDDGTYYKPFYEGIEIFERLYQAHFDETVHSINKVDLMST
ncbi:aminoglycoside phosphotransferase family protein [Bacillus spongiae]|uniref:Aminoglycoside phosphotransferase family protein n=1 Tax=Bacillus spongiae TaxID=2683610 RepID=A0ABU8HCJ4_9BACI